MANPLLNTSNEVVRASCAAEATAAKIGFAQRAANVLGGKKETRLSAIDLEMEKYLNTHTKELSSIQFNLLKFGSHVQSTGARIVAFKKDVAAHNKTFDAVFSSKATQKFLKRIEKNLPGHSCEMRYFMGSEDYLKDNEKSESSDVKYLQRSTNISCRSKTEKTSYEIAFTCEVAERCFWETRAIADSNAGALFERLRLTTSRYPYDPPMPITFDMALGKGGKLVSKSESFTYKTPSKLGTKMGVEYFTDLETSDDSLTYRSGVLAAFDSTSSKKQILKMIIDSSNNYLAIRIGHGNRTATSTLPYCQELDRREYGLPSPDIRYNHNDDAIDMPHYYEDTTQDDAINIDASDVKANGVY